MKSCSEFMAYEVMIILTTKFDHIVVEIEEIKKLSDDKSEDMQSTLETSQFKLIKRKKEKTKNKLFQLDSRRLRSARRNGKIRWSSPIEKEKANMKINMSHLIEEEEGMSIN